MSYSISILRRAKKSLENLPIKDYERLRDAVHRLADVPRPDGCRKLAGRLGWRIRVGDYRVIYEVDDVQQSIMILDIEHRRDIYR